MRKVRYGMRQKDMTEKLLEDYEDVFADIVNVLLFGGREIILPEALGDSKTRSQYKADDTQLHEMERDVMKLWRDRNVNIALYGIENQTKAEKDMPLRILGYDGSSYRSQLLKSASDNRYPVVTIVLYFGWKTHWSEPTNLKSVVSIPAELDDYINDYKIHVFEIAWLSDEEVEMFKSDFRIVADFFTQMRKQAEYNPSPQQIEHVDAVLKLLSVFGQTDEFEHLIETGESKEVKNMCEAVDKIRDRGRIQGLEEGIQQGRELGIQLGREIGMQQGKEIGMQQGKELGMQRGREIEREQNIEILIDTLRELGKDNAFILQKIVEKYSLTEEVAKQYL